MRSFNMVPVLFISNIMMQCITVDILIHLCIVVYSLSWTYIYTPFHISWKNGDTLTQCMIEEWDDVICLVHWRVSTMTWETQDKYMARNQWTSGWFYCRAETAPPADWRRWRATRELTIFALMCLLILLFTFFLVHCMTLVYDWANCTVNNMWKTTFVPPFYSF